LRRYENFHLLVPAVVVRFILDGERPETFEKATRIRFAEVSWGDEDRSYSRGHLPTSFHVDTDSFEPPPAWTLGNKEVLERFAARHGFTRDDTVILSGEEPMAAHRLAIVLRYIGVDDVRVLNGGLAAWTAAGYAVETARHEPPSSGGFGAEIPANPELIDTYEEVLAGLQNVDRFILVDNRSWEEHIGETSGYAYHDRKGRIPGAVFGYGGETGSLSLDHYRNIDNTMRNADEIVRLWRDAGIDIEKHLSFMCGSGWRAAEVLSYANVIGLDDAALYSDGWIGWSRNTDNPIALGDPRGEYRVLESTRSR
jgi:thiosulfate/3-mercaptopyruvate sulfurtransferase